MMTIALVALAILAAWGYHCWSVLRAYRAGMIEGGDHVLRQVTSW